MTQETRSRKWRWLRHTAWVLGVNVTLILAGLLVFFGSGAGNPFLKRVLILKLNAATGGSAEVQSLSVEWLALRAKLRGVVIHGTEPQGTEPLFSAEEIELGLRNDLDVERPHVHIRANKNGTTNIPAPPVPKRRSSAPVSKTLFDLNVKRV